MRAEIVWFEFGIFLEFLVDVWGFFFFFFLTRVYEHLVADYGVEA